MRLPYVVRRLAAELIGAVPVPVLAGPNRGRWWSLASAGRGFVAGRFESDRVETILALLRPGDVVWDIGAHKGYLTLAMARAVGPDGRVVAFEPSSQNLPYLRRHVGWNRVRNVEIVPAALSDEAGEARFGGTGSTITFRLGQGDETVRVRTIGDVLAEGRPPPTVLKLDVEGAEARVLEGAGDALDDVALVFVAVHDLEAHAGTRRVLERHGFEIVESVRMRRFVAVGRWGGDADLVAWRPGRGLTRPQVESLPELDR